MSETRVKVPEWMQEAMERVRFNGPVTTAEMARAFGEAALRSWAENPIRPTGQQIQAMSDNLTRLGEGHSVEDYIVEWQRRMFLAPEPEAPEPSEEIPIDEVRIEMRYPKVGVANDRSTELWQWFESVVFGKFGRSSSMGTAKGNVHIKEYRIGLKPEVPEEIKDMLYDGADFRFSGKTGGELAEEINGAMAEAFRRGKKAGASAARTEDISEKIRIQNHPSWEGAK